MNRFKGDRLPADLRPLTAADRRRAGVPARFGTRQEYRDFMREYVKVWRAKRNAARGTVALNVAYEPGSPEQIAQSRAASIAAVRRRARPGFCALCGHVSPVDDCPVCTVELMGRHASAEPIAWDALIAAGNVAS